MRKLGVPGVVHWFQVIVIYHIGVRVTVLKASELAVDPTAYSQYEIASAPGALHGVNGLSQVLVELEDIPQDEGKRIAETALLSEALVRIRYSYLRNSQSLLTYPAQHSDPACKPDVNPGVPILTSRRVVHCHCGILSVRSVEVPVKCSQLNQFPVERGVSPSSKHRAGPFGKLSYHMNSSQGCIRDP